MTEIGQITGDTLVSPTRVLSCNPNYSVDDFHWNRRSSTSFSLPLVAVVFVRYQLPVPCHQRVRHPCVLDCIKHARIHDTSPGGQTSPVVVIKVGAFLACRLAVLFLVDVQFFKQVVYRRLHILDRIAGVILAHPTHERIEFFKYLTGLHVVLL